MFININAKTMADSKPYWSIVPSSKNLCENNWFGYYLYPSLYSPLGHRLYFALQNKQTYLRARTRVYSKSDWYLSRGIVPLLLIVVCVQHVLSAINNILDSHKIYIQRKRKYDVFIQEEENEVYYQEGEEEEKFHGFCSHNSGNVAGKHTG